jgi:hypothetical protein
VGFLNGLSGRGRVGISACVGVVRAVVFVTAGLVVSGCDVRPLRSGELFGVRDAAVEAPAPDVSDAPDASTDVFDATTTDATDMTDTTDTTDATATTDAAPPDGAASACGAPCASDQFCDALSAKCAPRTGPGILSGVVTDKCNGTPLNAIVGIAGEHQCSFQGKGSFYFPNLPLARLKLAAGKAGYELFSTTVDIVPGGVVRDVVLTRTGAAVGSDGCDVPRPTEETCVCTASTCLP